jgi:uncharacterized protein with GYD domain
MAKYLFCGSYTPEGLKGLLKEGGSKRHQAAQTTAKSVGAKIEAFYFAYGENDFYGIIDAPDSVGAAAVSLAVNASGAIRVKTVVLITPQEMDEIVKKTPGYRAPGQ